MIFEEIAKLPEETIPTKDSFYKLVKGQPLVLEPKRTRGRFFYEGRLLRWFDTLNFSKKEFRRHYLFHAEIVEQHFGRSLKEDLQWLKEWEEAADKEGIY